ncbi:hypothetical protein [Neopusillimonas maritima]|uniref:RES domain-containing protein n=1 Tax=Neopusillimonas maritima TaxID=2026239 RepID=A0ABX9MZ93_9BURK|nr:hypothetical protein [Neopusillimonas maritima]RII83374.1 hypothetical protein CJO09_07190 [Neopusillimonas maritima]
MSKPISHTATPPLNIRPLHGTLYRFATPASHQATLSLTGNLRAAAVLNKLLESATPPKLVSVAPLVQQALLCPTGPWGHPMRGTNDAGLIAGSAHLHGAINACAQRQQQFWNSMPPHPGLPYLHSAHSLYSMTFNTPNGLSLRAIELPVEQTHTTAQILRAYNVAVFTYPAADPMDAPDMGVLHPNALVNSETRLAGTWVCEVNANRAYLYQCQKSIPLGLLTQQR